MVNITSPSRAALKYGYRSGLEQRVSAQILEKEPVQYEMRKIPYEVNKNCTYTPDFLLKSGIFIETKGRFVTADRMKHLYIKAQHPQLDIRFVFTNPKSKINKGSKTTYGDWCEKHGFLYAKEWIPEEWFDEGS